MPGGGKTMRSIICVVIMLALVGLTGCAKKDAAPADQSETAAIASEDFESGEVEAVVEEEVEAVVEEGEEVVEGVPDGDQN